MRLIENNVIAWNKDEIEKYVVSLKASGRRSNYINNLIVTWNLYNKFTGTTGAHVKFFKPEPVNKSTMSDEEIEAFLKLENPTVTQKHRTGKLMTKKIFTDESWERRTLFWSCCAFGGLRMNEAAKLTVNDLDFGRNVFLINNPTNIKKSRLIPIAPHLSTKLQEYIKGLDGPLLFPSERNGAPYGSSVWWRDFQSRIERIGVKRSNLTPYSLRHSFCVQMLDAEAPFPVVMAAMGHSKPETTLQYVHLSVKNVERAMARLPLVRKYADPRNILVALLDSVGKLFERDERFEKTIEDKGDEVVIRIKIKKPDAL